MVKKSLSRIYLAIIFLFLYLPIGVLIVLSFNNSLSRVKWGGFTTEWYRNLVSDPTIMNAFYTTILITVASSVIATIIGTMAAIGISAMRKRNRQIMLGATNIPLLNADIVTGISLMLLFLTFKARFGFITILLSHITFNIPYVILSVMPKLKQTNRFTYEAALDLGCTPRQAFTKVIMPQLSPAILSAFLICLTYSIDDFMISYFNSGTMQTLPIAIYSMTRKKVSPEINALSAVIFCVILAIILISNAADSRAYRRNQKAIRKAMLDEGRR